MDRRQNHHQINWYDFINNDSVRQQTKLVDLPLVIADRRHAIFDHIIRLSEETPAYSMLSMSKTEVTLQQDGSVHQADRGKHGQNMSSLIRTVTLT